MRIMTRSSKIRLCRFLLCLCAAIYVLFGHTLSHWTVLTLAAIVLGLFAAEFYEFRARRAESCQKSERLD